MEGTILIADDDRTIRTVLTQAFSRAGCKVHATTSLVTLLRWVSEGKGDLVISDVVMPDGNGLEMLPKIATLRAGLPVIVISAQNNIMTAIQAAEAAAYDYLPKPFDLPDLMKRAARALAANRGAPAGPVTHPVAGDDLPLVGRTDAMQALYRLVARVMNTNLAVLITGESGTGKSLIARAVHDFSDARNLPFVIASGADFATPDSTVSLLARVRGGTLMFDEVGDLDAQAQAKAVRMLDGFGENAPRLIASSQANLADRIAQGAFRNDLYYRLGGVTIAVPPLRERLEDIPLLCAHFLKLAHRDGLNARRFSTPAATLMRRFTWPGNVRQLENAVRRLAAVSSEVTISANETEAALSEQPTLATDAGESADDRLAASVEKHLRRYFDLHGGVLPPPGLYPRILREIEQPLIAVALEATRGNQAKCAELLGINRNTLRKKITELDIRVTRRRKLM